MNKQLNYRQYDENLNLRNYLARKYCLQLLVRDQAANQTLADTANVPQSEKVLNQASNKKIDDLAGKAKRNVSANSLQEVVFVLDDNNDYTMFKRISDQAFDMNAPILKNEPVGDYQYYSYDAHQPINVVEQQIQNTSRYFSPAEVEGNI